MIYFPPPQKKYLWGIMIWSVRPYVCASVRDLSVQMDISNCNEYVFPILYTCIYYNLPMSPLQFLFWIKFKMADLSPFLFAQIDKIFENVVRPDEYLPTPMHFGFRYFIDALTTILPWILWSFVRIKFKMADIFVGSNWQIFENFVSPDEYLHHQCIFVSDNLHMHLLQSSFESL